MIVGPRPNPWHGSGPIPRNRTTLPMRPKPVPQRPTVTVGTIKEARGAKVTLATASGKLVYEPPGSEMNTAITVHVLP